MLDTDHPGEGGFYTYVWDTTDAIVVALEFISLIFFAMFVTALFPKCVISHISTSLPFQFA